MEKEIFNKELDFISVYSFYQDMYDKKIIKKDELKKVKKMLLTKYKPPINGFIT